MQPLVFEPLLKQIRWGGRKLGTVLGKPIGAENNYAESWELADHGHDQTRVARGQLAGLTLHEVVEQYQEPLFGEDVPCSQFPLLIKFLDAADRLSVQVHPDDVLAKRYDPHENGKTEAWVILDAEPQSVIYAGLQSHVTRDDVVEALEQGNVADLLHCVAVRPGDCIFIPAGTVHAIGEGVLLAEIQQQSDLTFRFYDWGRLDADGQPRELHVAEAIDCTNFERGPVGPVTPVSLDGPSPKSELLVTCDSFTLRRHSSGEAFPLPCDNRFHVLMTVGGAGTVGCDDDKVDLTVGQTVLLPAERQPHSIIPRGEVTVLDAFLS